MRMELHLALLQPTWTLEYRRMIAQWIQSSYREHSAITEREQAASCPPAMSRDFTFSVYLPQASFSTKRITLPEQKAVVLFSCYDDAWGERFRQIFDQQLQRDEPFVWREDGMQLQQVRVFTQPPCIGKRVRIRLRSPLLVREQHGGAGERYWSAQDGAFLPALTRIVQAQAQQAGLSADVMGGWRVEGTEGLKRLRVFHQGKKLNASLGTCTLCGDARLLNYLYGAGMGSRRSTGFGLFDLEREQNGRI